jgi:glucokinase
MAGVFLGTGIGGGLIIEGKLYRGFNLAAGEFGQMIIDKGGVRAPNSFRGSLESLASHVGIARRLRQAVKGGEPTLLQAELGKTLKGLTSDHLRLAIAQRDGLAKRIVREAAEETGLCVAGIISALGPEYVMLGGGVVETLRRTMLPVIQKTAAANVLPGTMEGISILLSTMGEAGGIHGAAVFAREEFRQTARS